MVLRIGDYRVGQHRLNGLDWLRGAISSLVVDATTADATALKAPKTHNTRPSLQCRASTHANICFRATSQNTIAANHYSYKVAHLQNTSPGLLSSRVSLPGRAYSHNLY